MRLRLKEVNIQNMDDLRNIISKNIESINTQSKSGKLIGITLSFYFRSPTISIFSVSSAKLKRFLFYRNDEHPIIFYDRSTSEFYYPLNLDYDKTEIAMNRIINLLNKLSKISNNDLLFEMIKQYKRINILTDLYNYTYYIDGEVNNNKGTNYYNCKAAIEYLEKLLTDEFVERFEYNIKCVNDLNLI